MALTAEQGRVSLLPCGEMSQPEPLPDARRPRADIGRGLSPASKG